LGSRQINVTQEFLDDPQICATFQQMRRKRVADSVRVGPEPLPHHSSYSSHVESTSPDADPEILRRFDDEFGATDLYPGLDSPPSRTAERNDTIPSPFPPRADLFTPSHVTHRQGSHLGNPEPGGVEHLQQRPIAQLDWRSASEGVQDTGHGCGPERLGETLRLFWAMECAGRIGLHAAPAEGVGVESPYRRRLARNRGAGVPTGIELCQPAADDPSVDGWDRSDSGTITEVEELTQVPPVRIERVRRHATLAGAAAEILLEVVDRPYRWVGNPSHGLDGTDPPAKNEPGGLTERVRPLLH
jgi:hypothetical protein